MECTILKAFPLSRDGIKSEMQTAGDVVDVPDDLVDGLKNAGYVANGRVVVSIDPQPVVGETKAAGGKARQSKDHQVQ